jgi:hypothetical protein
MRVVALEEHFSIPSLVQRIDPEVMNRQVIDFIGVFRADRE